MWIYKTIDSLFFSAARLRFYAYDRCQEVIRVQHVAYVTYGTSEGVVSFRACMESIVHMGYTSLKSFFNNTHIRLYIYKRYTNL
jgi:hypothetical protein